jgi:hypothetical protein
MYLNRNSETNTEQTLLPYSLDLQYVSYFRPQKSISATFSKDSNFLKWHLQLKKKRTTNRSNLSDSKITKMLIATTGGRISCQNAYTSGSLLKVISFPDKCPQKSSPRVLTPDNKSSCKLGH